MNKYKLHTLINSAKSILEDDNVRPNDLKKIIQIIANEIQDPFASSIDEYLVEKQSKESKEGTEDQTSEQNDSEHPQENAVDELKDEVLDYKEPEKTKNPQDVADDSLEDESKGYELSEDVATDNPQDNAVDELKDEALDYVSPKESEHPQDELEDKVIDELTEEKETEDENESEENSKDKVIEAKLKILAKQIKEKGLLDVAKKFTNASSTNAIEILNSLLMQEFQIRDILENYAYVCDPETSKVFLSWKPKESILFLQKQISFFGGKPTTQRFVIPTINQNDCETILDLVKEATKKLIKNYNKALTLFGKDEKYFTLKVMLQKIAKSKLTM